MNYRCSENKDLCVIAIICIWIVSSLYFVQLILCHLENHDTVYIQNVFIKSLYVCSFVMYFAIFKKQSLFSYCNFFFRPKVC